MDIKEHSLNYKNNAVYCSLNNDDEIELEKIVTFIK